MNVLSIVTVLAMLMPAFVPGGGGPTFTGPGVQSQLPFVQQTVTHGSQVLYIFSNGYSWYNPHDGIAASLYALPHQDKLTTSVNDPTHPNEPWIVETYRRGEESNIDFINRHRQMCDDVREALEQPPPDK